MRVSSSAMKRSTSGAWVKITLRPGKIHSTGLSTTTSTSLSLFARRDASASRHPPRFSALTSTAMDRSRRYFLLFLLFLRFGRGDAATLPALSR